MFKKNTLEHLFSTNCLQKSFEASGLSNSLYILFQFFFYVCSHVCSDLNM